MNRPDDIRKTVSTTDARASGTMQPPAAPAAAGPMRRRRSRSPGWSTPWQPVVSIRVVGRNPEQVLP
jgi:hypothetical protein